MKHIIHKVRTWISGEQPAGQPPTLIYILVNPKHASYAEICAADPGAVIRRLVSFSSREALPLAVILPGRPNKRYPDGSRQNGVLVRYATSDQLLKVTEATVKETGRSRSIVLITDSPGVEAYAVSRHFKTLRIDTFEKALESVAGPLRRETRRPPEGTAPRPAAPAPAPENRPPAPAKEPAPAPKPAVPTQQPAPEEKRERDQAILDLIDPL